MTVPRREMRELLTRYKLEPSLRDVFVEGPSDKTFFSALFGNLGLVNAVAYSIETVNVPMAELIKLNLTEGNRQRVVTLASWMESEGLTTNQFTGVIDRDYECVSPTAPNCSSLIVTDYTCIEGYLWKDPAIARLLSFATGKRLDEVSEIVTTLNLAVRSIFVARAAAHTEEISVRWISKKGFLRTIDHAVTLDIQKYVERCLVASSLSAEGGKLTTAIIATDCLVPQDCRRGMNWHDAIEVLEIVIRQLRPSVSAPNKETISLAMLMAADWASIAQEPAMQKLIARVS